jgi:hypothetical protein
VETNDIKLAERQTWQGKEGMTLKVGKATNQPGMRWAQLTSGLVEGRVSRVDEKVLLILIKKHEMELVSTQPDPTE